MIRYNGLQFDRSLATALVYSQCEHGREFQPNCKECFIKEQQKTFAYLSPFDFECVVPTWLFSDIFLTYGVKPVSTKGVTCLMLASVHHLDAMCDPKHPFVAGTSKKWMKAAAPHRKRAQQMWDSTRDLFMQNLKSAKSILELIQVFERRIWEGMGIFMHINRKEPECGWQKWVENQVEKYGSRRLIPWSTINRCKADETDPIFTSIEADNKHKHELMAYEREYMAKNDPNTDDGPMKSARMAEDTKDDSDEESMSSGSSEDEDALQQEHDEAVKKFLGAIDKAAEDEKNGVEQPLIVSDDSDVEEMAEVVAQTTLETEEPKKRKTRKQKKKKSGSH